MPEQRRGRVIAMNAGEMEGFLGEERTCRLATLGPGGPHVSPVWFVWDAQAPAPMRARAPCGSTR